MIRASALAGLVLTVGACAAPRPPPAPTTGFDWFFQVEGEVGELAYGVPESDEILLHLECRRTGEHVLVSRPASLGSRPEIVLSAAGVEPTRLPAVAVTSQTHAGVDLQAKVPIGAPILDAFRNGGWLGVQAGGEIRRYVAQPAGTAVDRFFAWCRSEGTGTV